MLPRNELKLKHRDFSAKRISHIGKSTKHMLRNCVSSARGLVQVAVSNNKLLGMIRKYEEENQRLQQEVVECKQEKEMLSFRKKELATQYRTLKTKAEKLSNELSVLQRNVFARQGSGGFRNKYIEKIPRSSSFIQNIGDIL